MNPPARPTDTFTVLKRRTYMTNFGVNQPRMRIVMKAQANPISTRKGIVANGISIGFIAERCQRSDEILLREQGQSLNVPGEVIDRAGGGQDGGFSWSKGESNEIVSRDFDARLGVGSDPHDTALAVL